MKKLYILRKYVWAETVLEAIKKDSRTPVEDAWIDEDWKKNSSNPKDAIGFYEEKKLSTCQPEQTAL